MPTNYQSVQTFSQTGRFTADLVWGLRDAYVSIRALFGQAGAFVAALLGVSFLRAVLWFLIRQLKKDYGTDFKITPDNYKDMKMAQTALKTKMRLLAPLKQVKAQDLPFPMSFLLRGLLGQILTISTILENYHNALESQLAQLDKLETGDPQFKVVTESSLWSMRTPHYEYRF